MLTSSLIQRVQSLYSRGVQSDDTRLSPRHTYHKLLTGRSRLLSQKRKKKQSIAEENYVVLDCIELIKVDQYDCPCLPQTGCKVYRTKHPLPKILMDYNGEVIDWVMSLTNSTQIDRTTREAYIRNKGNRFTANNPRYILENDHMYFYGKKLPKAVRIKILPEDPFDALMYPSECNENIYDCVSPLDMDFPIDADLVETLIEMTVNELVVMFSQTNEDLTNDTKDSTAEQGK